ncbi:MAG: hypothetical protein A4E20_10845 [Nitrospira sp. SG-bin2]|uniref:Ig-like domain-containing protein n=1 Tax=Nitrospira cf. moscoviensis SBR1015 TaxID=96242 RepID=UPI000A09DE35|nr:Ig-like domain-containing protein [Nitrospira cf. moscoviensis SBR1015]OQW34509.1 MAG: hypothetical protein A4E20_10845 [Nitrospira sp. SG-bin2]
MPDFETIRDARESLVLANLHFAVLFDDLDNDAVSTLEDAGTGDLDIPTTAKSAGIIEKKAGVTLTHDIDSTDIEAYGEADPVRTIISKRVVSFDAYFLETNKVVLEKFWGTIFNDDNLSVSAHGGVVVQAPTLPRNIFYRAYLVATDDVNGDDLYTYYIMPRVKLVKVDNQDSKDNDAFGYKMTFRAFRDRSVGFSVAQGWCGPGWRQLVDQAGFVAALTSLNATPSAPTVAPAGTQQITVTGNNGVNYTPDCTFVSSDLTKATVSSTGLITGVATGSATVTVTYKAANPDLTDTVAVTVSA